MRKIIEMEFGSSVYGTRLPSSDLDFKAIAIPDYKDIIMQRAFRTINESTGNDQSKNTKDDIDKETFALHYFMKLLTEGQTVCLDMLFTPAIFHQHSAFYDPKAEEIWLQLQSNKDKLITKKMSAFAGYCQSQAAKYSLKGSNLAAYEAAMLFFRKQSVFKKVGDVDISSLVSTINSFQKELNGKDKPLAQIVTINNNKGVAEEYLQVGPKTKVPFNAKCGLGWEIFNLQYEKYGERAKLAQTNEGVDWKALMHAVRVCKEAIELCNTGYITFPRPEKELLLKIRKGEIPYPEVAEMIEQGLIELTAAKNQSSLPEEPDYAWIEDFIFDIYSRKD